MVGGVLAGQFHTLVTAHSDKQGSAPTFKRGFGHHPLWAFFDHLEKALAKGYEMVLGAQSSIIPFDSKMHHLSDQRFLQMTLAESAVALYGWTVWVPRTVSCL